MCVCHNMCLYVKIDQLDAPQCAREWHVMTHTQAGMCSYVSWSHRLVHVSNTCVSKGKQIFSLYKCIHRYTCVCACSHGFLGGIVWVCSCVCLQIWACRCGSLHVCVCLCNGVSACSPTIPETNMSRRRTTFEPARGLSHFFAKRLL